MVLTIPRFSLYEATLSSVAAQQYRPDPLFVHTIYSTIQRQTTLSLVLVLSGREHRSG